MSNHANPKPMPMPADGATLLQWINDLCRDVSAGHSNLDRSKAETIHEAIEGGKVTLTLAP